MSAVIWKWKLDPQHRQEVSVPAGAQFLCAREQHDRPTVWFICDPAMHKETRTIVILGTGQTKDNEAIENARYLGVCILGGGDLVLHVFEEVKAVN